MKIFKKAYHTHTHTHTRTPVSYTHLTCWLLCYSSVLIFVGIFYLFLLFKHINTLMQKADITISRCLAN